MKRETKESIFVLLMISFILIIPVGLYMNGHIKLGISSVIIGLFFSIIVLMNYIFEEDNKKYIFKTHRK